MKILNRCSESPCGRRARTHAAALLVVVLFITVLSGCFGKGSGNSSSYCQQHPEDTARCDHNPPPPPSNIPLTGEILNTPAPDPTLINTPLAIRFSRAVDQATLAANVTVEPLTLGTVSGAAIPITLNATLFSDSSGTLAMFVPTGGTWPFLGTQDVRVTVTQGIKAADDNRSLETVLTEDLTISTDSDTSISLPTNITVDSHLVPDTNPVYSNVSTPAYSLNLGEQLLFRVIGSGTDPICNNQSATIALVGFNSNGLLEGLLFEPSTEVQCTITLRFWDLAGNTSDVVFDFVFDQVSPSAPTVVPENLLAGNYTANDSVVLDVTPVSDPYNDKIRVTGGALLATQTITLSTENVSVSLSTGANNLSVYVLDKAGNLSSPTTLTVTRDVTAPVITTLAIQSLGSVPRQLTTPGVNVVNGTELDALVVPFSVSLNLDESADIQVIDVTNPLSPVVLAEEQRPAGNIAPVDFTIDAGLTLTIKVTATNAVNLTTETDQYTVTADTSLTPDFQVTDVLDGLISAYSVAADTFRTGSIEPDIEGVAERGATITFNAIGLQSQTTAASGSDVFPASGSFSLRITADGTTNVSATIADTAGNQATVNPAIAITSDQIPPDAPTLTGSTVSGGCTASVTTLSSGDVLVQLTGSIASCDPATLDGTVTEDLPGPLAGGATYVQADMDGSLYPASPLLVQENEDASGGPFDYSLQLTGLSANSAVQGTLYAIDRVGQVSTSVSFIVVTQDDATSAVSPVIIKAKNDNTGGRPDAVLGLSSLAGPIFKTSPTNATHVVISGITAPGAIVDLFAGAPPATPPSLFSLVPQSAVTANALTGEFQITIRPDSTAFAWSGSSDSETQSFTVRSSINSTDTDVEVQIVRDEGVPQTDNVNCAADLSPVFPVGNLLKAQITVAGACYTALQRTELVAQNLGAGLPACPVSSVVAAASTPLLNGGVTTLQIDAVAGDRLQIFFRDEAGNQTPVGNRTCSTVPNNRVALFHTGVSETVTDPTLQIIDLDAASPQFFDVEIQPSGAPLQPSGTIFFAGPDRLIGFGRPDSTHTQIDTFGFALLPSPVATLTDSQLFTFPGVAVHGRSDVSLATIAAPGSVNSILKKLSVNSLDGTITNATDITFPGMSTSNNLFPVDLKLLPLMGGRHRRVLILRFSLSFTIDQPGDVLLFDLDTDSSIFPAEPYVGTVNGSKRGFATCDAPSQISVTADGLWAYIICNNSVPSSTDLTTINLSPTTPTQGNAASFPLVYQSNLLMGFTRIVALPAGGMAVASDVNGTLYLLSGLDTFTPIVVTTTANEGHTYTSLSMTGDGTRLLAGNGDLVDTYIVGPATLTYDQTLTTPVAGAPINYVAPLP